MEKKSETVWFRPFSVRLIDFRSQLGDAVDGIERHARSQAPMQPCLPA